MTKGHSNNGPSWPQAPLGELGAAVKHACVGGPFGSELTTRDYVEVPGVPVIRGTNLGEQGFVDNGFVYVSEEKALSLTQNLAYPGDITFTQRGTIGQVALIPATAKHKRYLLSQSQMKLTPDTSRIDPRYLVHYFRCPLVLSLLRQNTLATGVPHINLGILRRIPVPLPPLAEQSRIADILDKADAIRRKRKEAIALTEELLRSAFLEMFGDPVTNPKGWEQANLGELCDVGGGLQVTAARAGNPIALPYLRVANVFRDRLDLAEIKTIRATQAEATRALLRRGDVLVVEGHGNPEELGRAAVWNDEIENCTHQNHLIRVRPDAQRLRSRYISAFLNSSSGRSQMLRLGKTTSGLNTISTNNVRAVEILVPPLSRQITFERLVDQCGRLVNRLSSMQTLADALFHGLVRRSFLQGAST